MNINTNTKLINLDKLTTGYMDFDIPKTVFTLVKVIDAKGNRLNNPEDITVVISYENKHDKK